MLIDPNSPEKVDVPHQPGEYILLRPLSVAILRAVEAKEPKTLLERNYRFLVEQIAGWSYPTPVNEETIGRLHLETYNWLVSISDEVGRRRPEEKAFLDEPSSPSPDTAEPSPESSST